MSGEEEGKKIHQLLDKKARHMAADGKDGIEWRRLWR